MANNNETKDVQYIVLQKFTNGYSLNVPGKDKYPKLVVADGQNGPTPVFTEIGSIILADKLKGIRDGKYIQISYKAADKATAPSMSSNEEISDEMKGESAEENEVKYTTYSTLYDILSSFIALNVPLRCYRIEAKNKDDVAKLLFLGDSAYFISQVMKVNLQQLRMPKMPKFSPIPYVEIPASTWNLRRLAAINPKSIPIPNTDIQMTSLLQGNKKKLDAIKVVLEEINRAENKAIVEAAAAAAKGKKGK